MYILYVRTISILSIKLKHVESFRYEFEKIKVDK